MARSAFGGWSLLLGAALALAGCAEGTGQNAAAAPGTTATARPGGARDVEAPQIFSAQGNGLWDGRPSLGGVWIAHPSVTQPQRARIVNTANGRTLVGALFRREREMPGPPFQVSSDAAAELGLLAGQPAPLSVVALTREETAPEPAAATAAAATAEATVPAAAGTTGATPPPPAPEGRAATDSAAPLVQPVPEDAPPSSFGRRSPRNAADTAGTAAPAEPEAQAGTAPTAETAAPQPVPEDAPPTSFGRRQPRAATAGAAAGAAAGDISVAPLDATAPAAAAPAPAGIARPYIQAAIFGTEANAEAAAAALRAQDVAVTVKKTDSNGTSYWRVLIGPAASARDQGALLEKARALGYRDAYAVPG